MIIYFVGHHVMIDIITRFFHERDKHPKTRKNEADDIHHAINPRYIHICTTCKQYERCRYLTIIFFCYSKLVLVYLSKVQIHAQMNTMDFQTPLPQKLKGCDLVGAFSR